MNKTYLGNAFSLQMLQSLNSVIVTTPIKAVDVPSDFISCIGHADTAVVVGDLLNKEVVANRINISLEIAIY